MFSTHKCEDRFQNKTTILCRSDFYLKGFSGGHYIISYNKNMMTEKINMVK